MMISKMAVMQKEIDKLTENLASAISDLPYCPAVTKGWCLLGLKSMVYNCEPILCWHSYYDRHTEEVSDE